MKTTKPTSNCRDQQFTNCQSQHGTINAKKSSQNSHLKHYKIATHHTQKKKNNSNLQTLGKSSKDSKVAQTKIYKHNNSHKPGITPCIQIVNSVKSPWKPANIPQKKTNSNHTIAAATKDWELDY